MKKYLYSIALLAMTLFMASCSQDMEEVFSTPASQRLDNTEKANLEVLRSAKNGWRMEFYGDRGYGGYNVFLQFKGDSVTVASEKFPGSTQKAGLDENGNLYRCTSHFKMEQSMGIILSLDEYNEIFHYFCEPKNADGIGDGGDGLYGDFEFRILSACADSVIMQGKKHQNTIKMYPVPENQTWEEIHNQCVETEKFMTSRSYYIYKDEKDTEITAITNYRSIYFYYTDSTNTRNVIGAPYIITPDGYKFYKEVEINGIKINGFKKGDTNIEFRASNDQSIALVCYIPTLFEQICSDRWYISYSELPSKAQTWWNSMHKKLLTAGMNKKEAKTYYAFLGECPKDKNVCNGMIVQTDLGTVRAGFKFTQANEDGTEITITDNPGDSNELANKFSDKYNFDDPLMTFLGEDYEGRTFTLETDNNRNPTYILMTDKKNPNFKFKIFKNYYEFGFPQ